MPNKKEIVRLTCCSIQPHTEDLTDFCTTCGDIDRYYCKVCHHCTCGLLGCATCVHGRLQDGTSIASSNDTYYEKKRKHDSDSDSEYDSNENNQIKQKKQKTNIKLRNEIRKRPLLSAGHAASSPPWGDGNNNKTRVARSRADSADSAVNTCNTSCLDLGLATWNINHLNKDRATFLDKANTIGALFQENKWLDILVLQEINQASLTAISEIANKYELVLELGPRMQSVSANRKSQVEYYPILYRQKAAIVYERCWALHHTQWIQCSADSEIIWTKPEHAKGNEWLSERVRLYRPAIVHRLQMHGRTIYITVVHTTPKGTELSRSEVYEQVRLLFETMSNRTTSNREYWISIGDFYLDPEAAIRDSNDHTRDILFDYLIRKERQLKLVISLSATNQKLVKAWSGRMNVLGPADDDDGYVADDEVSKVSNDKASEVSNDKASEVSNDDDSDDDVDVDVSPEEVGKLNLKVRQFLRRRDLNTMSKMRIEIELKRCLGVSLQNKLIQVNYNAKNRQLVVKMFTNRRADFLICSHVFKFRTAGILRPGGGLLRLDPGHNALNWWANISDHSPVGAILCTRETSSKFDDLNVNIHDHAKDVMIQNEMYHQSLNPADFDFSEVAEDYKRYRFPVNYHQADPADNE